MTVRNSLRRGTQEAEFLERGGLPPLRLHVKKTPSRSIVSPKVFASVVASFSWAAFVFVFSPPSPPHVARLSFHIPL
jgi:hypothetical protein